MILKLYRLIPLAVLALLPLGCTSETPTPEEKIEAAMEESAVVPEGDPTTPLETLPPAKFPEAVFMIQKGDRSGIIAVTDIAHGEADKANWSRLALGSNGMSYDLRVQFLGHGDTGDLYGYTIYEPYPESTDADPTKAKEAKSGEIEFKGQDILFFEDEENGVHYHLSPIMSKD